VENWNWQHIFPTKHESFYTIQTFSQGRQYTATTGSDAPKILFKNQHADGADSLKIIADQILFSDLANISSKSASSAYRFLKMDKAENLFFRDGEIIC
jgi:hypothetical protein